MADVVKEFEDKFALFKEQILDGLVEMGEEAVEDCRRGGTYKDQTGELRKANGYMVTDNGVYKEEPNHEETAQALRLFGTDGVSLIIANGKHYASHVEKNGYNVQSSAYLSIEQKLSESKIPFRFYRESPTYQSREEYK